MLSHHADVDVVFRENGNVQQLSQRSAQRNRFPTQIRRVIYHAMLRIDRPWGSDADGAQLRLAQVPPPSPRPPRSPPDRESTLQAFARCWSGFLDRQDFVLGIHHKRAQARPAHVNTHYHFSCFVGTIRTPPFLHAGFVSLSQSRVSENSCLLNSRQPPQASERARPFPLESLFAARHR